MESYKHILKVSIERPYPDKKLLLDTLTCLQDHYSVLPCLITKRLLDTVEQLVSLNESLKQSQPIDDTIQQLRKKLPQVNTDDHVAFFPVTWRIQPLNTEKHRLYGSWSILPNTQQTITINTNNSHIRCEVSMQNRIGINFAKHPDPNAQQMITDAHAVYACCAAYSTATVIMDPTYKHYQRVALYLSAYAQLAKMVDHANNTPTLLIQTKGHNNRLSFSEQELQHAMEDILKGPSALTRLLKQLPDLHKKMTMSHP